MELRFFVLGFFFCLMFSSVFAFSALDRALALNFLGGNQARLPLFLGEYNTGLVFTRATPLERDWFVCFPLAQSNLQYSHVCNLCEACR